MPNDLFNTITLLSVLLLLLLYLYYSYYHAIQKGGGTLQYHIEQLRHQLRRGMDPNGINHLTTTLT